MELERAPAETTTDDLRQRVRERIDNDAELVVAPQFFEALPGTIPKLTSAWIEPKRGRASNELTRFRYDVSLQVGDITATIQDQVITGEAPTSFGELRQILSSADPTRTTIMRGLKLDRPATDLSIAALLAEPGGPATAGDIRSAVPQVSASPNIEEIYGLSTSAHQVDLLWPSD